MAKQRISIATAIMAIGAASVYAFITYGQWRIIGAGLVSLGGSLAMMLMHPSSASAFFKPALVEYWLAAAAWCLLPWGLWLIWRRTRNRAYSVPAAAWTLAGFVIVAVCAPVIAPLPPLAQANLRTMRFLPPLSRGVCITDIPDASAEVMPVRPWRVVQDAEILLTRRTIDVQDATDTVVTISEDHRACEPVIFLLGTDALGRDVLSRMMYGARYSLGIGAAVVVLSIFFGSCIGMAAGYRGGIVDTLSMRAIDVLMSVPTLFLVLMLMALLGQSVAGMIIVLSATEWMGIARIVRGEVFHLRTREFVSASRLLGTSPLATLRIHILPNVRPAMLSAAVLQLGNILLAEASLSFLGLGIQAPNPSWGNMIADAMGHMNAPLGAGVYPGIALSVLIVAVYRLGEHTQQAHQAGRSQS